MDLRLRLRSDETPAINPLRRLQERSAVSAFLQDGGLYPVQHKLADLQQSKSADQLHHAKQYQLHAEGYRPGHHNTFFNDISGQFRWCLLKRDFNPFNNLTDRIRKGISDLRLRNCDLFWHTIDQVTATRIF